MTSIGLQQRVLPSYRAPFFETLGALCPQGLSIFAGEPLAVESIATAHQFSQARCYPALNHHLLDPSSPFYLCWQQGLTAWLEVENPEVLIVEANPRYLSTPGAIAWMHRRDRPVLGWGLGAPVLGGGFIGSLRSAERTNFLKKLDGMIAYSQRGAAEYIAAGFPPERVFVAANAAVPKPANPPLRSQSQSSRPVALFVGRLQARKRLDLLFEACARLPLNLRPELVVVGDGPARAEFEQSARQRYPGARFVGAQHGAALDAYFAAADLFVLPGTGGLAVQQAMAAGLPVIVARGDGTQDDLVRPESGWQITPDDPQALFEALQTALSDRSRLRQMGLAAYRIVVEEINLENMAESFLHAVQRVQALGIRK